MEDFICLLWKSDKREEKADTNTHKRLIVGHSENCHNISYQMVALQVEVVDVDNFHMLNISKSYKIENKKIKVK